MRGPNMRASTEYILYAALGGICTAVVAARIDMAGARLPATFFWVLAGLLVGMAISEYQDAKFHDNVIRRTLQAGARDMGFYRPGRADKDTFGGWRKHDAGRSDTDK